MKVVPFYTLNFRGRGGLLEGNKQPGVIIKIAPFLIERSLNCPDFLVFFEPEFVNDKGSKF